MVVLQIGCPFGADKSFREQVPTYFCLRVDCWVHSGDRCGRLKDGLVMEPVGQCLVNGGDKARWSFLLSEICFCRGEEFETEFHRAWVLTSAQVLKGLGFGAIMALGWDPLFEFRFVASRGQFIMHQFHQMVG